MSMLTRKGTIIRSKRGTGRKNSLGWTRSGGSGKERAHVTEYKEESILCERATGLHGVKRHDRLGGFAGQSVAHSVVCFNDNKQLYQTNIRTSVSHAISTDQQTEGEFCFQIQEANRDADDGFDFVCRVTDILCKTIIVIVCIVILMVVPTIMVSIGVKYLSDCPVEPKIPVYLLVGGFLGVLKLVGMLYKNVQIRRYESMDAFYDAHGSDAAFASHTFKLMDAMLTAFLVGWQIAGTYWVFSVYEPNFHQLLHEPSNWCEKNVYRFAVMQILGCYSLMCLGLVAIALLVVCYKYTGVFST